ncbi:MAG TPA: aromatic ring-hydroxylating dioxygenase subunit alpha [Steroidobacteraceae bacterium]|nr:aromatic ring-hydroxylating dioxygenase subunit alpha [Steroidobacteraceae bacterium]
MMKPSSEPWDQLLHHDGVHGSVYVDPRVYESELQHIWRKTWVYVGHESEVPRRHDFVMKSLGPEPVIMTRDGDGQVRLLLNRCSHRGNQVCTKQRGNAAVFTCPYHAWSFGSDGRLKHMSLPDGFPDFDRSTLGLAQVTRVASYRGFVFGSFAPEGPSLAEHLGGALEVFDRLVALSPEGEIEVTAGFLQHKVAANWKLMLENETDGYHPSFVHSSIFGVADSGIGKLYSRNSAALSRDYGNGHTECDLRPQFRKLDVPLGWFGTTEERLPDYARAMRKVYGNERARQIMIDGTPHVMIFPNLFIAEIQIFVLQPVAVDETVQHVTALQFKGAPDLNRRMRQQTMGSVGPAGLLLADDSEIYERTHQGLRASGPQFTFIGRGVHRERTDDAGFRIGDITDDLPSRGIWRHYRSLMEQSS